MSVFQKLTDKNNGEARKIEEFNGIFHMEIYTSVAGASVTLLWFFIASVFEKGIRVNDKYFYITALLFGALIIYGFICRIQNRYSVADQNGDHPRDSTVRVQVILLSGLNTIVFGILIFLTGGALSAVIPLYAMTFTLTITESRATLPTTWAFFFFFAILFIASSSYWFFDLIKREIILQLSSTPEVYIGVLILSLLSLFVPYTALLVTKPRPSRGA